MKLMDNLLTHLRQEHFSGAEEFPDGGHAGHEGTLDDVEGPRVPLPVGPRHLGVFHDEGVDALDQGMPGEEGFRFLRNRTRETEENLRTGPFCKGLKAKMYVMEENAIKNREWNGGKLPEVVVDSLENKGISIM